MKEEGENSFRLILEFELLSLELLVTPCNDLLDGGSGALVAFRVIRTRVIL